MKVLYIGVHDQQYPRNARIRRYMEEVLSWEVEVYDLDIGRGFRRNLTTMISFAMKSANRNFQYVFLAEFSSQYAVPAWFIAQRSGARLVTDLFVGLYETRIGDYRLSRRGGLKARAYKVSDYLARTLAWRSLIDTDYRASMLNERKGRAHVLALPVGAPQWARPMVEQTREHETRNPLLPVGTVPIKLLYYGNYIPLHGVDVLIEALALVDMVRLQVTLVGSGPGRASIEQACQEKGIDHACDFRDSVPQEDLHALIMNADIVAGIFGQSLKASGVIANKVWQGLYCGKIVVTRESEALDEISSIVGDQLVQVPAGDPHTLSNALRLIIEDKQGPPSYRDTYLKLERYTKSKFDIAFSGLS